MQKTVSVVDLRAIRANAIKAKQLSGGGKFYAVVKADGYGHGAEEVSRHIEDIADGFCVAIIEEGIALRIAGISKPILVFTPPLDGYDVRRARAYNLTVTVNSADTARACKDLSCHIKVNTGMNRMGCSIAELPDILKILDTENIEGVYSHLYAPHDTAACAAQYAMFERAARLVKTYKSNVVAHLSASGGLLRGGRYLFDGVRAGIILYGYVPYGFTGDFRPALKVYARRAQITEFVGGGIGYNRADRRYKKLGVYRCGYADGFFRGTPLGEKTLCMDSFISQSGEDMICVMDNADAYAKRCGTISYEVLTSVTRRSERIYKR